MPVLASFSLLALLLLQQFQSVPLHTAPRRVSAVELAPSLRVFFIRTCIYINLCRGWRLKLYVSASSALELEIPLPQTPPPGLRQLCIRTACHHIFLESYMYIHYLDRGMLPLFDSSPRLTGWNREARLAFARRAGKAFLVCLSSFLQS